LVQLEFALTDAYRDKKVVGNADTPCVRAPANTITQPTIWLRVQIFYFSGWLE
jgi:hypothetical protein